MQTIILNDTITLTVKTVIGGEADVQNMRRKVLEFNFRKDDYSFAYLENLFGSKPNTDKITVNDVDDKGNPVTYLYEGYNLRSSMVLKPELLNAGDISNPPLYEDIITVTMAQESYYEKQVAQLLANQTV